MPDGQHKATTEEGPGAKIIYNNLSFTDTSGNYICSIKTDNGLGVPILVGPAYIPVLPVGIVTEFAKSVKRFRMNMRVDTRGTDLVTLAWTLKATKGSGTPYQQ